MSELSDIYNALMAGKAANESLATWQRSADGNDLVRSRQHTIEAGITAYNKLSAELRDGRKHVEPPEDYELTSCGCVHPGAMPPCSYCTREIDEGSHE